MTIDERLDRLTERHEALAMNLEVLMRDVETLRETAQAPLATAKRDGENIRALARIADMHDRRPTRLEKGELQ